MRKKGFTLIELLVVAVIIVIIASLVIVALTSARKKSRDTKRVANLDAIRGALEMYKSANGKYPSTGNATVFSNGTCDPVGCGDASALVLSWQGSQATSLATVLQSYLPVLPKDPSNNKYAYSYKASTSDYRFTAYLEDSPDLMTNDGGTDSNLYEIYTLGTQTASTCTTQNISDHLVISEVYYNPNDAHWMPPPRVSLMLYQWVEIYNPTNNPLPIGAIESAGNRKEVFDSNNAASGMPGSMLPAHRFALIMETPGTQVPTLWNSELSQGATLCQFPDDYLKLWVRNGWAAPNNPLSVTGGYLKIWNQASGGQIVDQISWGTDTTAFSPSTVVPVAGDSIERTDPTCDTGTASDFSAQQSPSPDYKNPQEPPYCVVL